jgi:dinuclear metal center YbgI/SA1388 family protein
LSAGDAPALRDVRGVLDALYDPRWAQDWDAVGLVTGDPDQPVCRVLFAVDPVDQVIAEAAGWGADLLVTHHPLLLRGVHSVATDRPKGRAVTALLHAGIALHVAHTNADIARPGVSDALAALLGVEQTRPLRPVPEGDGRGLGRVGRLAAPETLRAFGERVAAALPRTPSGLRMAGDLDSLVQSVAVCGGAGDDLFDDVRRSGADVFVTADLRHHPASESLAYGPPALVDCPHWATEWPWLLEAETLVRAGLAARGTTVETRVSHIVTDPWSCHLDGTTPTTGEPR